MEVGTYDSNQSATFWSLISPFLWGKRILCQARLAVAGVVIKDRKHSSNRPVWNLKIAKFLETRQMQFTRCSAGQEESRICTKPFCRSNKYLSGQLDWRNDPSRVSQDIQPVRTLLFMVFIVPLNSSGTSFAAVQSFLLFMPRIWAAISSRSWSFLL